MSVYVDDARIPYGRMKMCHMLADTREELEAMARKIGLPSSATLQSPGQPNEHIDVSATYRAKAVQAGAIEVDSRALVKLIRSKRAVPDSPPDWDVTFDTSKFAPLPEPENWDDDFDDMTFGDVNGSDEDNPE